MRSKFTNKQGTRPGLVGRGEFIRRYERSFVCRPCRNKDFETLERLREHQIEKHGVKFPIGRAVVGLDNPTG